MTRKEEIPIGISSFSDPGEARTLDPMIKSHLLYQLSYGVMTLFSKCDAKVMLFFCPTKFCFTFFVESLYVWKKCIKNQMYYLFYGVKRCNLAL